jgi:beta-ureidopropionase / N-carbamoyl-L-amino-acid hydrolase
MVGGVAGRLSIPWIEIASGAGHDARHVHHICPTGMIFIPCRDGINRNEAESIQKSHATANARIFAEATFELADML